MQSASAFSKAILSGLTALVLAACETHGLNATYYGANLETAMRNGFTRDYPALEGVADWPATQDCLIPAILTEIPLTDQSILVQSLKAQDFSGGARELYIRYFWYSPTNGEIVWPGTPDAAPSLDGRLRFSDGEPVPDLDFDLRRRMRKNFEAGCPELAEKYPHILSLPPMEDV